MNRGALITAAALLGLTVPTQSHAGLIDYFLYFPESLTAAQMRTQAKQLRLQAWPADGETQGFLATPGAQAKATAVVFHGNAGHALHRSWYAHLLTDLGLRTLLVEYPGYGARRGKPNEAALIADATAILRRLRNEFPGPLLVIGESLGAGVAAAVAASAEADALVLITPWNNLAGVADYHYPWLPTRWLTRGAFDSAANLAGFGGRIAVVIAESDEVIPPRLARALYDALPPPNKFLRVIAAAGHNDWPEQVDSDWWRTLIGQLLPGSGR